MNPAATAARRAGQLLMFIGVLTVLGVDWSIWDRIAIGIALLLAVVVTVHLGSDSLRPKPTRYDQAA
ncbi:hypothetical protein ABTX80_24800 [Streptomyces erythrochromogenes]|uniref:hypothetical protein n=1 Tax=Streptomyces erythrochromogenes TaxID=285574 RepID=UPI00332A22CC